MPVTRLIANVDIGSNSLTSRSRAKREQDRGHPDHERQQRGDEAAEHEQREQEQDRRGQQLRPREVGLDLLADLRERHRRRRRP